MTVDNVTLAQIRAALAVTYTPDGVSIWMNTPNRGLHGQRPIHLCDTRAGRRLVAEAVARLDGVDPREMP